jgi:hypothetical protein
MRPCSPLGFSIIAKCCACPGAKLVHLAKVALIRKRSHKSRRLKPTAPYFCGKAIKRPLSTCGLRYGRLYMVNVTLRPRPPMSTSAHLRTIKAREVNALWPQRTSIGLPSPTEAIDDAIRPPRAPRSIWCLIRTPRDRPDTPCQQTEGRLRSLLFLTRIRGG